MTTLTPEQFGVQSRAFTRAVTESLDQIDSLPTTKSNKDAMVGIVVDALNKVHNAVPHPSGFDLLGEDLYK